MWSKDVGVEEYRRAVGRPEREGFLETVISELYDLAAVPRSS
jgi:hypothetical protein